MNVAHFESGAITRETARPESRQAALVRQFGQRIDLIHELRKLAAAEEIADDRATAPSGLISFCGVIAVDALIEQRHALFHQTLGAGQTDAALVGQQFANGADAAAAQMIDVIQRAFTLLADGADIWSRRQDLPWSKFGSS